MPGEPDRLAAYLKELNKEVPDGLLKHEKLMASSIENRVKVLRELLNPEHASYKGVKLTLPAPPAPREYVACRTSNEMRVAAEAEEAAAAEARAKEEKKKRLEAQGGKPAQDGKPAPAYWHFKLWRR